MAKDREGRTIAKSSGKGAGRGGLSDDDFALWEHTARTLKPLKGKKQRAAPSRDEPSHAVPRRPPEPERSPRAAAAAAKPAPAAVASKAPPPIAIDRRKARQIGSGRIEVEGKIDLHGMRQSEAHAALRRFLLRAHADERRWVLVITGKGDPLRRGYGEVEDEAGFRGDSERGVLKRNVPRWLAEPELSAIVVGYTEAAVRHGGAGALYVQLRRKRGG
jgi:DNA-nicking Smr family endonuclease